MDKEVNGKTVDFIEMKENEGLFKGVEHVWVKMLKKILWYLQQRWVKEDVQSAHICHLLFEP